MSAMDLAFQDGFSKSHEDDSFEANWEPSGGSNSDGEAEELQSVEDFLELELAQ
jgi:hypothetical protein